MNKFEQLFNLDSYRYRDIFEKIGYPWEILAPKAISKAILSLKIDKKWEIAVRGMQNKPSVYYQGTLYQNNIQLLKAKPGKGELVVKIDGKEVRGATWIAAGTNFEGEDIFLGPGSLVEEGATVRGPFVMGEKSEIRQGAYLRGEILGGDGCVIGHASEVKGSVFLNDSKAPHFAYVGDSILGARVNLGAGTKLSNLKMTGDEIVVYYKGEQINTGLRKFGAILGDDVETGCNSVLNPGVIMEKQCMVYPCAAVKKNYYDAGTIVRNDGSLGKRRGLF